MTILPALFALPLALEVAPDAVPVAVLTAAASLVALAPVALADDVEAVAETALEMAVVVWP